MIALRGRGVVMRPTTIGSILVAVAGLLLYGCPAPEVIPTTARMINHTNFDPASVSDADILAAAALDVYFEHASVGQNIVGGIDALAIAQPRYTSGRTSSPSPAWYDSNNGLGDNDRGNPGASAKISGFTNSMDASSGLLPSKLDVATYKFCWIDLDGNDDDPTDGTALFNAAKAAMEILQADYPGVVFVWWTMPIERDSAYTERQEYNDAVRAYCSSNDQWLLDIADLESHNDSGVAQLDGSNRELLYDEYTDDGGHLNAAGSQKLAKAYWKLLAEIAKDQ